MTKAEATLKGGFLARKTAKLSQVQYRAASAVGNLIVETAGSVASTGRYDRLFYILCFDAVYYGWIFSR